MRWMKLEPIIQSEVSQKDKYHYIILAHIYGIYMCLYGIYMNLYVFIFIWKDSNDNHRIIICFSCKTEKETHIYRTDFWTLWEKARVGYFKRTASKHIYYLWWDRSPAQVGYMRQMLGPGALVRPRGIRWRGRWEGGSGWGIHVTPWLINVHVWQNPLQYCN